MATHSSILAWRIPGTEEHSGLPSMGSHRVGHDWSDLAAAAAAAATAAAGCFTFWRIPEVHSGWGIYLQNGPTECIQDSNDDIFVIVQLLSCVWLFTTHGLQQTWFPCPSLIPGVCSNSCPLSQWCYPTISSSATPFSSCPQSFSASGSFPMSRHLCIGWPKY